MVMERNLPAIVAVEHDKMECAAGPAAPTPMRHLLMLGLLVATAAGAPLFTSGPQRTHLLELFSSEGCSSCPPAEQWLGRLRDEPGLWRDFVPVAFHVTYWDRLGWPDQFARPEFTARQYAYSGAWGSSTVYTPGFVLDGKEWQRAASAPGKSTATDAGILKVEYRDDGACRVRYSSAGDFEVHAALLGAGIVSAVRAGENSGRTLRHDFVALLLKTAPLSGGAAELTLPKTAGAGMARLGLAVWITRRGELAPVQAAGSWLD
jgi:hypothetical protein